MAKKTASKKKTVGKKSSLRKIAKKTSGKAPARKKTVTKNRKTAKKATSRPVRQGQASKDSVSARRRRWLKPLLGVLLIVILVFAGYLLWLDHEVTSRFEGKRWAIPARVYARPLELYEGKRLTVAQLLAELKALGYQPVANPRQAGAYSRKRGHFLFKTRAFVFWDERASSRLVDLTIRNGRIRRLRDDKHQPLPLIRLDAAMIGSIYPAHHEDRVLLKRDELPDDLVNALLATEDRQFYSHFGVNPRSILRALIANLRSGHAVQGGSTLTQQLVKNFYLSSERTLSRKIHEALMALLLEVHYGKDEILEAYANEIYLGQDGERAVHGFGLASWFYFGRPLGELDLARIATLVAIVKGPSYFNPRRHPERVRERRDLVLGLMESQGYITAQQAIEARKQGLGVTEKGGAGSAFPAFMDLVKRQLHEDYREEDLTSEGLRVFTTLDPWQQQQAQNKLAERLVRIEKARRFKAGSLQGAVVIASRDAGEISALVGGRDALISGFNRALDARRSIGSLVKPAVYLRALMEPRRYNLLTRLPDEPVRVKLPGGKYWEPKNYSHKAHGEVPLHRALAKSLNLATVHLGMDVGLETIADLLHKLGVKSDFKVYPSMLLGAIALPPFEVAQYYHTLASNGFRAPLKAIRTVMTADGEALQRYPISVEKAVDEAPLFLLDKNLQEVVREGTGRSLGRRFPKSRLAGKTGTTDELRDSWFAGFDGAKVMVVWVGRDDNKSARLTGSSGAMRAWGDILAAIGATPLELTEPDDIELLWVDPEQGLLAAESCPRAVVYPFIASSAPGTYSSCVRRKPETQRTDNASGGIFDGWFGND